MSEVDSVMSIPPNDLLVKFDVLHHRVAQQGKKKFVVGILILLLRYDINAAVFISF